MSTLDRLQNNKDKRVKNEPRKEKLELLLCLRREDQGDSTVLKDMKYPFQ